MFQIAEFARQKIQAARAPEVPRSFRVFQQRVAALDDAVGHHAVKCAAVVVALAREPDELIDMLRGFVGRKFEAECAQIGGNDGLQFAWLR